MSFELVQRQLVLVCLTRLFHFGHQLQWQCLVLDAVFHHSNTFRQNFPEFPFFLSNFHSAPPSIHNPHTLGRARLASVVFAHIPAWHSNCVCDAFPLPIARAGTRSAHCSPPTQNLLPAELLHLQDFGWRMIPWRRRTNCKFLPLTFTKHGETVRLAALAFARLQLNSKFL